MSVINQMLKDLEQRAPEPGQPSIPTVAPQKTSTLKIVFVSALILLSLNALGFYIWNLQERVAISEAKQQKMTNTDTVKPVLTSQAIKVKELNNEEQQAAEQQAFTNTAKATQNLASQSVKVQKQRVQQPLKANSQQQKITEPKSSIISTVAEKAPEPKITEPSSRKPSIIEKANTSQMSVSRRQLSSKELVTQKLARAEKSLNSNEITKAEQLFEEILIIDANHKQARKKLAALWFGRKSYRQALNLLSQGIAIDKQDGELRLMKARIHLKQGQHEAAFNTLKPLTTFAHEEYQVMLANIAQQIEQYSSAISAYQVLINMQPYSGRWHLGLAIVYDKNSQFLLAVNEYALALTKADLSASSAKFAAQRMQALGE